MNTKNEQITKRDMTLEIAAKQALSEEDYSTYRLLLQYEEEGSILSASQHVMLGVFENHIAQHIKKKQRLTQINDDE